MEGSTTDESARGAVGCKKRRCHESEPGIGASVCSHSSDRSGSNGRDNGGSDGNGPSDKNASGENGWTSSWSRRNGGE